MIAFVAAESRELAGLERRLEEPRGADWGIRKAALGKLGGREAVLVCDGPGPKLAGRALEVARGRVTVDAIVSTGFCGGLEPGLEAGAIFVASKVMGAKGESFDAVIPGMRTPLPFHSGSLLSIDRVAVETVEKHGLRRESGASAVEMEALAVAQRAHGWKLPFSCVRVVSDSAAESFSIDFNRVRDSDGRFSRVRILMEACRRPFRVFPELIRFEARSRRAANALGDFLANCEF